MNFLSLFVAIMATLAIFLGQGAAYPGAGSAIKAVGKGIKVLDRVSTAHDLYKRAKNHG